MLRGVLVPAVLESTQPRLGDRPSGAVPGETELSPCLSLPCTDVSACSEKPCATANLHVTFTRGLRVVTAEICFGCETLWLRFDEDGRRMRDDSFDLEDGWLAVFAPLVPEDDYVAQRKQREDELEARAAGRMLDGGVP